MKIQINTYGKKIILMLNYCYLRFRLRRDMPMQWLLQYSMHTTTVVKEKHAWLIKKEMSERGGYGKTNYNIICIFDQKINKCISSSTTVINNYLFVCLFAKSNQINDSFIHSFPTQPNNCGIIHHYRSRNLFHTQHIYYIYHVIWHNIIFWWWIVLLYCCYMHAQHKYCLQSIPNNKHCNSDCFVRR